jgi:hypothetical protein
MLIITVFSNHKVFENGSVYFITSRGIIRYYALFWIRVVDGGGGGSGATAPGAESKGRQIWSQNEYFK